MARDFDNKHKFLRGFKLFIVKLALRVRGRRRLLKDAGRCPLRSHVESGSTTQRHIRILPNGHLRYSYVRCRPEQCQRNRCALLAELECSYELYIYSRSSTVRAPPGARRRADCPAAATSSILARTLVAQHISHWTSRVVVITMAIRGGGATAAGQHTSTPGRQPRRPSAPRVARPVQPRDLMASAVWRRTGPSQNESPHPGAGAGAAGRRVVAVVAVRVSSP